MPNRHPSVEPVPAKPVDGPSFGVILQEAWRNFTGSVTRGLVFGLAMLVLCGGVAGAQARMVVGLAQEAAAFRQSGAAVWIMSQPGGIGGAQCDALASLPGVVASGGLRAGALLRLAVIPSTPVTLWEVTPGFADLLDGAKATTPRAGVWLSDDLAQRIGATASTTAVPVADGSQLKVAGVYRYPTDGRLPILSYTMLSPVASDQPFDQCWVMAWPQPGVAATVLPLALLPTGSGPGVQQATPTTTQLNSTLGSSFDGPAKFAALPLLLLTLACMVIGAGLGYTSIRTRRLEMACSLHMGMPRRALNMQIAAETLIWTLLAVIVATPACILAATVNNPGDIWAAYYPSLRSLIASIAAVVLGALGAMMLIREKHFFRYFKHG